MSNLSPWLHFGQLAPQRAALEAAKMRPKFKESVEGFLEELVREGGAGGVQGVRVSVIEANSHKAVCRSW